MAYSRYILLALLFSLVCPAGCGSRKQAWDPAAQSGTSSEEIWYQHGGARVAYTAVARPKQLYTGYGAVRDPALYGQVPATTQAPQKKRSKPKPQTTAAAPRHPDCPPCPPTDAAKNAPQSLSPQPSPVSLPAQGATSSTPSLSTDLPSAVGSAAPPPSPSRMPLPGMPAATSATPAPSAPGT